MSDELKKIDLAPVTKDLSSVRAKRVFPWKVLFVPLGVFIVMLVVIGLMLLPIRGVIAKAKDVASSGTAAAEAIKNQDLEKTKN